MNKRIATHLGITLHQLNQSSGYAFTFIALGMSAGIFGPTLPSLAEQTGTSLRDISLLFITRPLGNIIGSLFVGRFYDRFAGHRIMGIAILVMAGLLSFVPVINHIYLLAGMVFLLGFASITLNIGGNALILQVHPERATPYVIALHFTFSAGAFLAPMLVALAISISGSFRTAYWVLTLLVLLPGVLLALTESPALPPRSGTNPPPTLPGSRVLLFAVFFFLYVSIEAAISGWIYTYGLQMGIADAVSAAYLSSAFWGSQTLGRLLTIPLAARFPAMRIILGGIGTGLCSTALMNLWPASQLVVWPGIVMLGLSLSPLFATMLAVAREKIPVSGKTTGWFFFGASSGGMVMPWLVGQFFESGGPVFLMRANLIIFFVLLLITWQIRVMRRGQV